MRFLLEEIGAMLGLAYGCLMFCNCCYSSEVMPDGWHKVVMADEKDTAGSNYSNSACVDCKSQLKMICQSASETVFDRPAAWQHSAVGYFAETSVAAFVVFGEWTGVVVRVKVLTAAERAVVPLVAAGFAVGPAFEPAVELAFGRAVEPAAGLAVGPGAEPGAGLSAGLAAGPGVEPAVVAVLEDEIGRFVVVDWRTSHNGLRDLQLEGG